MKDKKVMITYVMRTNLFLCVALHPFHIKRFLSLESTQTDELLLYCKQHDPTE